MKNELLKGVRFESIQEVTKAVEKAVRFYNEEHPHMSVDMKTPRDAADNVGDIPKRWTRRREMHLKNQRDACNNPEICLLSDSCRQG
ncbi:integrase core domain-containing protein [Mesosutterella porci]|uniref:integrase core domain-containing protein n=1 Tax=Mesosutterella porci TaxID=2915351 RepID=UPI00351D8741